MFRNLFRFIFGDLRLKGIALAIAVAVWFYASGRTRETLNVSVPLVVDVPDYHTLLYKNHDKVTVRIGGPSSMMRRLDDIWRQIASTVGNNPDGHVPSFSSCGLQDPQAWRLTPVRALPNLRTTLYHRV